MAKTAKQIAEILFNDSMSRADEVPIEDDGHAAYDKWQRSAGEAGDEDTIRDLRAVDRDDFAAAWNELRETA